MVKNKIIGISGIDTNIGKTIVSAILVEKFKCDYWKMIQSGDLDETDTMKVKSLVSNQNSKFHAERFQFKNPLSPHHAAKLENISVKLEDFQLPKTKNNLLIEGAGGLMVPINEQGDLVIDLFKKLADEVILVSKNYLGSINHTLLSIDYLKNHQIPIKGIIFNGETNAESENIIEKISGVKIIGRIEKLNQINSNSIKEQTKNIDFEW